MLKLMDITKAYGGNVILKGISQEFEPGILYVIRGENGAGKSTLFKIISGVIYKTSGTLIVDGMVSYLPDKFRLPRMMKVKSFIRELLGKDMVSLMKEYDLPDKRIGELSKGNLAKLGILYAFARKSDIYILDEPQDGLDDFAKGILKEKIKEALKDKAIVLLSLHQKGNYQELDPVVLEVKEGSINEKKKKSVKTNVSVSSPDLPENE